MTIQNAIDLSKIPAPDVLFVLDFETIYTQMLARFQQTYPEFIGSPSDPYTKALEIAAFYRLEDRQLFNEASKQNRLPYAGGTNLDSLCANLLVTRLSGESDDNFRARTTLAPEGFSTAGPEGAYIYHAKSAHPEIEDVRVTTPAPSEVVVAVMGKTATGIAPQPVLDAVFAALNAESIRPITDFVTVQSAQIIDFQITATLKTYNGPDAGIVLTNALSDLNQYLKNVRKIGHDITTSGIIAALFAAGVQRVTLTSPATDVLISSIQAGNCTAINVTVDGIGE